MRLDEALQGVTYLFLDTAPVIYYVEKNPQYFDRTKLIFDRIDQGLLRAVTSAVTLAECLIVPCRLGLTGVQQDFIDLIVYGHNTLFALIGSDIGRKAADLRARYNLGLTDALQIATALSVGCEAFLTNDDDLSRVTELKILILDRLEFA